MILMLPWASGVERSERSSHACERIIAECEGTSGPFVVVRARFDKMLEENTRPYAHMYKWNARRYRPRGGVHGRCTLSTSR